MANKMLIDATHPEETRVVVLRGNRVEEFDFESAHRKQLRGNIYLAKVTRVEPSLQAAFVDYGGNRHGFLAFSEIHPDYYQIPVADRQALIDEEERAERAADDELDRRSRREHRRARHVEARRNADVTRGESGEVAAGESVAAEHLPDAPAEREPRESEATSAAVTEGDTPIVGENAAVETVEPIAAESAPGEAEPDEPYPSTAEATALAISETDAVPGQALAAEAEQAPREGTHSSGEDDNGEDDNGEENGEDEEAAEEVVESVGGSDALEEVPDRTARYRRQYKIQEVIKRRQVMLVQVVKEERGTKGAALTTYLSLAGRYSVLMPNTARGGGISRKITNAEDRSRLKDIAQDLEVPEGMGVILRTAGASRTKTEIKRDFEYLLRMWETVRDLTLRSTAPKLVYEEGSLVKRSIRDLYGKDIDEVIVAGPEAYGEAKEFMRMLMPSHAKNVKLYSDTQPLLSRYGVENQLDAMFSPLVQLRSGGYVVLNQAEALVAIDVNSGRATREHHIEDTALKTNLEAADEIARQLRLRDLAGLIVIDFIDMDEKRNNRAVERRLKECLKQDRARIQVGRISHFGLLEMSRQRIRASVLESSTEKCPYCGGSGHVRSVSSLALQVLRGLEEQLIKGATHNLVARTRPDVALYVLNQKRAHLGALEERFRISITIAADESMTATQTFAIDRGEQVHTIETARALAEQTQTIPAPLEEEDDLEEAAAVAGEEVDATETSAAHDESEGGGRRRRRRRRRGRDNGEQPHGEQPQSVAAESEAEVEASVEPPSEDPVADEDAEPASEDDGERLGTDQRGAHHEGDRRRRRRGRRGGRRNRHEHSGEAQHGLPDEGEHARGDEVTAEQFSWPPPTEPDPNAGVVDLETAPTAAPPPPPEPEIKPEVVNIDEPAHAVSTAESESSRRRSTVREPAPVAGAEHAAPTPQATPEPVITELNETDESDERPRRTGWWSRRSAGG
jgi:ribonuclease E